MSEPQPETAGELDGLGALRNRRQQRAKRLPPPPRHPSDRIPTAGADVSPTSDTGPLTPVVGSTGTNHDEGDGSTRGSDSTGTRTAAVGSTGTKNASRPAAIGNVSVPQWSVERLARDPNNPVDREDDVSDITGSIDVAGIMQALSVVDRDVYLREYPHHADAVGQADFVVIDGNRRLKAATLKGLPRVPINRDNKLVGGSQDSRVRIIANLVRRDLAPTQEARELERLLRLPGETHRSVGDSYGRSHSHVAKRLKLLTLPEPIRQAVDAARNPLPVIDALTLAELETPEDQLAAFDMIRKGRKARSAVLMVRADRHRTDEPSSDDLRTVAFAARDGACVELLIHNQDPDERARLVASYAVRAASNQALALAHGWLRSADIGPALDDPTAYAAAAAQRPADLLQLAYAVALAADELHARDSRRDTWDARATAHHQRLTNLGHITTEWEAAHLTS